MEETRFGIQPILYVEGNHKVARVHYVLIHSNGKKEVPALIEYFRKSQSPLFKPARPNCVREWNIPEINSRVAGYAYDLNPETKFEELRPRVVRGLRREGGSVRDIKIIPVDSDFAEELDYVDGTKDFILEDLGITPKVPTNKGNLDRLVRLWEVDGVVA